MTDEVVSRLEQVGNESGVRLEVDAIRGRVRREPGPVDDDELEALGQRSLCRPGRATADDAPVHEDDSLHKPPSYLVTKSTGFGLEMRNRVLQAR